MHSIGFTQASGALKRMLEGPPPKEDNELIDICIADVWTDSNIKDKSARPVSIYCTVEVNRAHVVTRSVPKRTVDEKGRPITDRGQPVFERNEYEEIVYEQQHEKGPKYGHVVNFYRNFRYHDGDDAQFSATNDGETVRDENGNLTRSHAFNPRHCYPGLGNNGTDISKLSWPRDVSAEKRAEFHRETFYNFAGVMLMGASGKGRLLNPAFIVRRPEAKPEAVSSPE